MNGRIQAHGALHQDGEVDVAPTVCPLASTLPEEQRPGIRCYSMDADGVEERWCPQLESLTTAPDASIRIQGAGLRMALVAHAAGQVRCGVLCAASKVPSKPWW